MVSLPLSEEKTSVLEDVLDRDSIQFAILYGSQATGDDTLESDIDIGLMFESNSSVDPYTVVFRIEEEYADAGFDDLELDLSVLNTAEERDFITTVQQQAIYITGDKQAMEQFIATSRP